MRITSYSSGKYDGEFFERKLHQKCEDVLNEVLLDTGENEFDYEMIQEWWKEKKSAKNANTLTLYVFLKITVPMIC